MYIDNQLLLSDAQAITADAASTNLIDLGSDRDIGRGEAMGIVFTIDVAADFTTGNETYTFNLETDDNSSFSSAEVIGSRTLTAAQLVAGSQWVIPVPFNNERFLRLAYDVGGTTPTVTVTAWLSPLSLVQSYGQYPDAVTIS